MNLLLLIFGVLCIAYAIYSLVKRRPLPSKPVKSLKKQKITLEELSKIWLPEVATKEESIRRQRTDVVQESQLNFQHQEITDFYLDYVANKPYFLKIQDEVVRELLNILDRDGDCPSVVNTFNDEENRLPKDAYDILAQTPLWQHSLNVTKKIIELLGDSRPLIPKAVITALAHDLGKIPSYRDQKLYVTGDHPLISIGILNKIEAFNKAFSDDKKDEIFKAIRNHHRKADGLLCQKLKEADQAARRKELAENSKNIQVAIEIERPIEKPIEAEKPISSENKDKDTFYSPTETEKEKIVLVEQELSWFDPDEFLTELNPYINRLNGGRWDAFSMNDGYVYFQVKTLWEVAKKIARRKGNKEVLLADADESMRQNILYTIVSRLRSEKDAIARGLIQDTYFGAPFVVTMRDGKKYDKSYYTPFVAEVFAPTVSSLEARKVGKLKDIIDVSPKYE